MIAAAFIIGGFIMLANKDEEKSSLGAFFIIMGVVGHFA